MNFEELFQVDDATLKKNVDYQLEAFFLDIVENIHHEMKRTGMNQTQLAAALGVTPGRISALMRGYKKNLSLRTITEIAAALGVEPQDLCARRKTTEMMAQPTVYFSHGLAHRREAAALQSNESAGTRVLAGSISETDGEPFQGARRAKK